MLNREARIELLRIRYIVKVLSATLSVLFAYFILNSTVFTDEDTNAAEITANISYSNYYVDITSSKQSIKFEAETSISGAAYFKIDQNTINVKSNVPTGYKVYLSTDNNKANGNRLYHNGDISSTSFIEAVAGTPEAPTTLGLNTWGFAVQPWTAGIGTNNFDGYYDIGRDNSAKFAAVPLYSDGFLVHSATGPNTNGQDINVFYAINVNAHLKSGSYKGKVVYTAIADSTAVSATDFTITPAAQDDLAAGHVVKITTPLTTTLEVEDLGEIEVLIGNSKCTSVTASVETGVLEITCKTPAVSAAGEYDVVVNIPRFTETYVLNKGYKYTKSETIFDIEDMQAMTPTICSKATTPSKTANKFDTDGSYIGNIDYIPSVTLKDTRDNKTYTVRKLADGNCWMIDNLALELAANMTLDPETSDVSGNLTLAAAVATDFTQENINKITSVVDSYGGFYNWYTATATTGTSVMVAEVAEDSICPANWQLPNSGTGDLSFYNLANEVYALTAGAELISEPFKYKYNGYYDQNTLTNRSSMARYWSNQSQNANNAHDLYINNTLLGTERQSYKYNGETLRCVARSTLKN